MSTQEQSGNAAVAAAVLGGLAALGGLIAAYVYSSGAIPGFGAPAKQEAKQKASYPGIGFVAFGQPSKDFIEGESQQPLFN